jgi:hypothetical protein
MPITRFRRAPLLRTTGRAKRELEQIKQSCSHSSVVDAHDGRVGMRLFSAVYGITCCSSGALSPENSSHDLRRQSAGATGSEKRRVFIRNKGVSGLFLIS